MFALLKPCIVNTPDVVNVNNAIHVYIGHGDGDTKWKGCAWKVFLVKYVILYLNLIRSILVYTIGIYYVI
jgi:hypothetical protein